jgi:hypothetical protein
MNSCNFIKYLIINFYFIIRFNSLNAKNECFLAHRKADFAPELLYKRHLQYIKISAK